MKNDKKIFILIEFILAAMVAVTAFILMYENANQKVTRVSVVLSDFEAQKWTSLKYGLKMAAQDEQVEISFVSAGRNLTTSEKEELIEQEIAHGTSAILLVPENTVEEASMLDRVGRKTSMMLLDSDCADDDHADFSLTEVDHYAMGQALAEALISDYAGNLKGKKIGLVSMNENAENIRQRRAGFLDKIADKGAVISWSIEGDRIHLGSNLAASSKVDLIVAFDDESYVDVGALSEQRNVHGALLYGIGQSMEAVYYLDTGVSQCLVVPDEFSVGYYGLCDLLQSGKGKEKNSTLGYDVLYRSNLFDEHNQSVIFTMSQ